MIKTVLIIGGESTGKSALAEALAEHYQTVMVPEYARTYLGALDRPYTQEDLSKIAIGQLTLEETLMPLANGVLICDTGMDVIRCWSMFKYGSIDENLLTLKPASEYDLILVTAPDLPWEPDPLRENPSPEDRDFLFRYYCDVVEKSRKPFGIVAGMGEDRVKKAIQYIDTIFPELHRN